MPPRRPADDLRSELVALFLADGFADLTIARLADRLSCSRSTLYGLAASKEQLIGLVVRTFFREATERVEAAVRERADASPRERLRAYLDQIATELSAASPAFFADLDRFEPAGEIYRQNTAWAAERVRALVAEADPAADAGFVGTVAGLVMEAIHRGRIEQATGLGDADAYRALADLLVGQR